MKDLQTVQQPTLLGLSRKMAFTGLAILAVIASLMLFNNAHAAIDITAASADLEAAEVSMGTIVQYIFGFAVLLVAFAWVKAALFK